MKKPIPSDARLCRFSVDRGWTPIKEGIDSLSKRELQVLEYYGNGIAASEAAKQLGISTKTIQEYRTRLFLKLNLSTTADLVHFALRHGIVENKFTPKVILSSREKRRIIQLPQVQRSGSSRFT